MNSLKDSFGDLDIDNSIEELNNFGEIAESLNRKKKVVVLKDNNKVPEHKVRNIINEKIKFPQYHMLSTTRNNNDYNTTPNQKNLTPICVGI